MNYLKKHRLQSHIISVFFHLFVICAVLISALRIDTVRESMSEALARNAFFIPKGTVQRANIDGLFFLREAFFGQECIDEAEEILILPNTHSPQTSQMEYPTQPELGIFEDQFAPQIPKNLYPIVKTDLSCEDILTLNDTTKKAPNTTKLLEAPYDFGYSADLEDPLVLILHTHATECYSREGSTYYEENSLTRTNDKASNMIAVGAVLAKTLNDNGIPALHCEILHDEKSYSDSYNLSAGTVKEYLKKYPSIKYVFDVHRDAVMYESGAKARPVTEIDGREAAQIMLLSGTDAGGADFPHWQTNLSFALKLADKLSGEYPSLLRPIALRGASYNQQYTDGSLLIEIGTDGNTLSQASYSAEILGRSLAKLIKGE